MSDIAIRVENLSKLYHIGALQQRHDTLRDALVSTFQRFNVQRSNVQRSNVQRSDELWALRDVSFEVKRGEVVGIIGRNGAGKSTLLKILSRITEPTAGRAIINGRVGSLLEVGTGFHPELTGRENIYLNGAILGMRRREIEAKFDEIVAFAETERFLDTPVKRYSSGMYVRLAFAVAAHLEPEILLVDEVLAVGDAQFQKKCLGKMGDVAKEGRTVLFVSHNMGALLNLCPRAVLLVQGKMQCDGPSREVVRQYIEFGRENRGEVVWNDPASAPGNDKLRLHAVRLISDGEVTNDVEIDKDIQIEIEYWNFKPDNPVSVSIHVFDRMNVGVLASANMHSANLVRDEWFGKPFPTGLFRTTCVLPGNFLNAGTYTINAILLTDVTNLEVRVDEAISFTVHETGAMREEYGGVWLGVVRPKLAWQTQFVASLDGGSP